MLEPILPSANPLGSPRTVEIREVVNVWMYIAENGIQWRSLLHDFPAWQTVYGDFFRWRRLEIGEQANHTLSRQV
ncbi:IS5 family transposase [Synechococcus elongatus]|uniref:Pseudo transposase n=1 Tax=Synechococcus sp. (strain ATCC 27144 / PCC 6301 / SAUG 1402/1) TaxID=269084 RepID=A0A0H3K0T3_SYNP6|nr:IS5 family transposase [Synechococcus elongatus]AJD58608.1 transposase [Synechococcus elongatus UTEX 2973]MBD2588734.1 IS5 family transposase [Synechococcus elongatus FACHB-242]MBD2689678.1 IS5 family transposase [Synechococcus elongatus FACHB-1061]MBD2708284.1 IS5 family transposase [Synechococcus elongatus PCC 7942 = FACHB-805]UOW70631.1 IS5 family transposase [Synechococcus elongatus PCC 7943]